MLSVGFCVPFEPTFPGALSLAVKCKSCISGFAGLDGDCSNCFWRARSTNRSTNLKIFLKILLLLVVSSNNKLNHKLFVVGFKLHLKVLGLLDMSSHARQLDKPLAKESKS